MYKITDLIEKLIKLEELVADFYIKKFENTKGHQNVKVLAKALYNQEKKHIQIYEKFKKDILDYEDIAVEFDIYDKASKLIYDFMSLRVFKEIYEVKDLLELALTLKKDNLALIKSIRGLFVSGPGDVDKNNYKLLSVIVNEEEKHIEEMNSVLRKINVNI